MGPENMKHIVPGALYGVALDGAFLRDLILGYALMHFVKLI